MSQPLTTFKEKILEKIIDLPEYKLKGVLDFIDFLRSKREETEDPILKVAGYLSGSALSAEEIEEELYGK
jgi:hypothetical protein